MNSIKIEINKFSGRKHIILGSRKVMMNHQRKPLSNKKVHFADELGLSLVHIKSFVTNSDLFSNGDFNDYLNFDFDDGDNPEEEEEEDNGIEILSNKIQFSLSLNASESDFPKNLQIQREGVILEVKEFHPDNYEAYEGGDDPPRLFNRLNVSRRCHEVEEGTHLQLEELNLTCGSNKGQELILTPSEVAAAEEQNHDLNGVIRVTQYLNDKEDLCNFLRGLAIGEVGEVTLNESNVVRIRLTKKEVKQEVFARWTKDNWSSQLDIMGEYAESVLEIHLRRAQSGETQFWPDELKNAEMKELLKGLFLQKNMRNAHLLENGSSLAFSPGVLESRFRFSLPLLSLVNPLHLSPLGLVNDRNEMVTLKFALCVRPQGQLASSEVWDNNLGRDYSTSLVLNYTNTNNNTSTMDLNHWESRSGNNSTFDYNNYEDFYANMSMAYY